MDVFSSRAFQVRHVRSSGSGNYTGTSDRMRIEHERSPGPRFLSSPDKGRVPKGKGWNLERVTSVTYFRSSCVGCERLVSAPSPSPISVTATTGPVTTNRPYSMLTARSRMTMQHWSDCRRQRLVRGMALEHLEGSGDKNG